MGIQKIINQKVLFDARMIDRPATKLVESEAVSRFMENVIEVLQEHAEGIAENKVEIEELKGE